MTEPGQDGWHELWGTFSVRDHCRPGGFIPEVLIYDRLVLPVVPTADDLEYEARALGQDPKRLAASEWERWVTEGWDPARQTEVAKRLKKKDRAELIPWTFGRRDEWASSMKQAFGNARRDGFFMTGSVLQGLAPAMARTVVAVPQYGSLEELEQAERLRRLGPHDRLSAGSLLAVLGHELLLPAEPEQDDFRYLDEALDVSGDPIYRERRRSLYEWQQKFVRGEHTDKRSIAAAVEEMKQLVRDLETATSQQRRWTWTKRCFTVVGAGATLAAALLDPALGVWIAGGSAAATVGTLIADERAPKPAPGVPAATLVLEARQKLSVA